MGVVFSLSIGNIYPWSVIRVRKEGGREGGLAWGWVVVNQIGCIVFFVFLLIQPDFYSYSGYLYFLLGISISAITFSLYFIFLYIIYTSLNLSFFALINLFFHLKLIRPKKIHLNFSFTYLL